MTEQLLQLTKIPPADSRAAAGTERARLERRARLLAHGGNAWHVIEFAVALSAGIAAGSIALIGFGADSLVEVLAGTVIVWLFTSGRGSSARAERRAQQLVAASFFALAASAGAGTAATAARALARARRFASSELVPRGYFPLK